MNKLLIRQLDEISKNYPEIESILLFGSRAHGDHNQLSDIDLAVKAPALSELKWLLLTEQLEKELETLLKIDIILYDNISEVLRAEIDQCHVVVYQK